MTVMGHLTELRKRIVWSAAVFLAATVLCFTFIQYFVDAATALSAEFSFVYLSPSELVTCYLKLSLVLGLVLSSPFLLWQVWAFVAPGLTEKEASSTRLAIVAGFVFFLIGAAFCFGIVLPITLQFFYNFNGSTNITPTISFNNYMSFVLGMLVAFGMIFEMPVLAFLLARLGVIRAEMLKTVRKYAILVVFIIAAVITPPDVVSQLMTAVPMLGLYELAIAAATAAEKQRKD